MSQDYDDGLDADGYPISTEQGLQYRHGEEEECAAVNIASPCDSAWLRRLAFAAELSKRTESPIETMLGLALHEVMAGEEVDIVPQFKWRRYRIDWAVRRPGGPTVFVECDGNEFHTQASDVARDHERDAAASKAGINTLRFTGSEIYHDAEACARVVRNEVMA